MTKPKWYLQFKNIHSVNYLWSRLRARQQETYIHREWQQYHTRANWSGIPSELSEPELKHRLKHRLLGHEPRPKTKGQLHILYATPFGIWEKHNIPPALKNYGIFDTFYLKDHGFNDRDDDWLHKRHGLDQALLEYVTRLHERQPVDVLISYLSGWHIHPETIKAINHMGIITCAFWWDDRLSFRGSRIGGRWTGAADLAAAYDLNLTNASDSIVKYLVEGGLAIFWPEAANQNHFYPLPLQFKHDVSFIGARYGRRPEFIHYIEKQGIKVAAYGPGWPNGTLSPEEMVVIYSSSRINLGFSGIGYSMKEMCLKGRDFEVPMCGALYLTNEQPDLHRVYKVGDEVIVYRDEKDCVSKIRYLLAHPDDCKCIRKAARERCLATHSWEYRFDYLFRLLGLING